MVRPIVEYAAAVWNPPTNRDVSKMEQVHKNEALYLFVTNVYGLPKHFGTCHLPWLDKLRKQAPSDSMYHVLQNP